MATTPESGVDPSNEEMWRAWNGIDGNYWAENAAVFDGSLRRYERRFLDAAAIEPGDRVLDIGCGNGLTTCEAAAQAVRGKVLGVDLSAPMIEQARRRVEEMGLGNVELVLADAQVHPFDPGQFDVAISRTGSMFFGDPTAAFANIARAMRTDGRLVLLVWQSLEKNVWMRKILDALAVGRTLPTPAPGAPGPFSLADPDRVQALLTGAGFTAVDLEGVDETSWFGDSVEQAVRFVSGMGVTRSLIEGLTEADRARALEALRASVESHLTGEGVLYPSAAWIVRARRA